MKQSINELFATTIEVEFFRARVGNAFEQEFSMGQHAFLLILNMPDELFFLADLTSLPPQGYDKYWLKSYEMARAGEHDKDVLLQTLLEYDLIEFCKQYGIFN